MKKIAVVIPYFGSWPEWFHVFLETCRYNEKIEWIFFTDCPVPNNIPKNTCFEEMDLKSFGNIASKKTGVDIEVKKSYKVCDFRPAYGEIFREYLKGYDFWGWGDIDVVYGDLKRIFTKSRLQKYDVISVRRRRTAGPLTVLRNEKRLNTLYKKSPDFKKVFKSDLGYAFDESGKWGKRNVVSITDVIKKYKKRMGIKTLFWKYTETDKKTKVEEKDMYWEGGKMYKIKSGEEVFMYHFVDEKKERRFYYRRRSGYLKWLVNWARRHT